MEPSYPPVRRVSGRRRRQTAERRALAYAVCAALLASPHTLDPRAVAGEAPHLAAEDGPWRGLSGVMAELGDCDLPVLQGDYSSLFEVGDEGPPVPIREEHHPGGSGLREEIVRYYEHFGYSLSENFAWQPDHLSIELEFLQFLCLREAAAPSDAEALSFQLAQRDFSQRHPGRWLPLARSAVEALKRDGLYTRIVAAAADFVAADLAWQAGTISGG